MKATIYSEYVRVKLVFRRDVGAFGHARARGVPAHRWVYTHILPHCHDVSLHGSACAHISLVVFIEVATACDGPLLQHLLLQLIAFCST